MGLCINLIEELKRARKERDMYEQLYKYMRKKLEFFLEYDVRKVVYISPKDGKLVEIDDDMLIEVLERNRRDNHGTGNKRL